jgi:hypothetical protein
MYRVKQQKIEERALADQVKSSWIPEEFRDGCAVSVTVAGDDV